MRAGSMEEAMEAVRVVMREFLVFKKGVVAHELGEGMWYGGAAGARM